MKREHGPEQLPREFDIQVGRRLRMARFGARLTPSELARMVGSDEAEIESWETGSSVIYLDELMVLCRALNVTPHDLLGWRGG